VETIHLQKLYARYSKVRRARSVVRRKEAIAGRINTGVKIYYVMCYWNSDTGHAILSYFCDTCLQSG